MVIIRRTAVFALIWFCLFGSLSWAADIVYRIDFTEQPDGNAFEWLKRNGFKLQNDADEINARFENGRLILEVDNDINGLFTKALDIKGASTIRIEWGVDRYPSEANWERGILREAIGVVVAFGSEKISSGSFVVPDIPYFIGIFLGQHEIEGKAYLGNYYQKGGRYFCSPCGSRAAQSVITEFNLSETFKREFGKSTVPAISAITLEVDARDTDGRAKAFIKSVSFLSP